jgi:proteasome accessory factor C
MTETAQGRLGRRLRRILLLLPYAIKHPGLPVDELAAKFGIKRKDLLDDLSLVFLCGLPGYGPGDLIDASVEENRVYIRMADYFSAPFRLTPAEALSLYASGTALASLPGMEEADALRRALVKVGLALGLGDGSGVDVQLEGGTDKHLEVVQTAVRASKRVRLEYFSATRGELSTRDVDPWGLVAAVGRWYLVGFDHLTEEERMFRVDRIKNVEILEEPSEVPDDFDPARYSSAFVGGPSDEVMTFEISPTVAKWFGDYYPVESMEELGDGWSRVTIAAGSKRWAALLLLRLGQDARGGPSQVTDVARETARKIAARASGGAATEV